MKIIFAVVWLMSNGSIVGDQWQYFDTMDECYKRRAEVLVPVTEGKFLFLTACLDPKTAYTYQGIQLELLPGQ